METVLFAWTWMNALMFFSILQAFQIQLTSTNWQLEQILRTSFCMTATPLPLVITLMVATRVNAIQDRESTTVQFSFTLSLPNFSNF